MKRTWVHALHLGATVVALAAIAVFMVPAANAAPPSANASLSPTSPPAGAKSTFSFKLTPATGQIGSFNLTAPSGAPSPGWSISPLVSPPAGVTRPSSTLIQGRGLTITASSPLTVTFDAQVPCVSSNPTWSVVAKTGGNFTGNSFNVNQPSTPLTGTCAAAFVSGPADAAFNGGSTSQNITSEQYKPNGTAIQVLVTDAETTPQPVGGVSITLSLSAGPTGATLSGAITATSDQSGLATFDGSSDPITIDTIGLNYVMTPTGESVAGQQSEPFGIYQDGHACAPSCKAHGNNGGIDSTVTATGGTNLAVLVSPLGLNCGSFTGRSPQVTVWKYVGTSSQTLVLVVDKSLLTNTDRGSAHLDFCFDSEGKTFTDKFGVVHDATNNPTPGLLPDCNSTITVNCIVSETSSNKGARIITVTVEDGHGRI
jgi:hypothetical protein